MLLPLSKICNFIRICFGVDWSVNFSRTILCLFVLQIQDSLNFKKVFSFFKILFENLYQSQFQEWKEKNKNTKRLIMKIAVPCLPFTPPSLVPQRHSLSNLLAVYSVIYYPQASLGTEKFRFSFSLPFEQTFPWVTVSKPSSVSFLYHWRVFILVFFCPESDVFVWPLVGDSWSLAKLQRHKNHTSTVPADMLHSLWGLFNLKLWLFRAKHLLALCFLTRTLTLVPIFLTSTISPWTIWNYSGNFEEVLIKAKSLIWQVPYHQPPSPNSNLPMICFL